ncbi:BCS1 N terminal-domain-containing protein [Mycena galopus ATCC 62051]|nr:BCS1 N terminal-domain-containing protein [Mycena galopus ATCC 62051]
MDALRSLVQPLVNGSSVVDGMKLVVIGGTVETARRMSSSAWSHFVNSFFLTAHFSEEDHPYDWLMLWLSRRPEWQRSREFETTTRAAHAAQAQGWEDDPELAGLDSFGAGVGGEDGAGGASKTRVIFQPTFDTTHTIYWRGHWLRVRRGRGSDGGEVLSVR